MAGVNTSSARCLALLSVTALVLCAAPLAVGQDTYAITSTPTDAVPSDQQLSSSQAFSKQWQIGANAASEFTVINSLNMNLPGRVFVTYDESKTVSNDSLAEIAVSGSTKQAVEAVTMEGSDNYSNYYLLNIKIDKHALLNDDDLLLTEVKLSTKNAIMLVATEGSADFVIREDVLISMSEKEYYGSRRLSTTAASATELSIELDPESDSKNKQYDIKPSESSVDLKDSVSINLHLDFPGEARIDHISWYETSTYFGYVKVPAEMDNLLEVVAEHGQVRVQLKSGNAVPDEKIVLDMTFLSSVQVKVDSASERLQVVDVRSPRNHDIIEIYHEGEGNMYVSDTNATKYEYGALFSANGKGNLQVDLGEIFSYPEIAVRANSSSNVSFFVGATHGKIIAAPNGQGRICLSSESALAVDFVDVAKSSQLSYPNKGGGSSFSCSKQRLPDRVPARVRPELASSADGGWTGASSTSGASASNSPDVNDKNASSAAATQPFRPAVYWVAIALVLCTTLVQTTHA